MVPGRITLAMFTLFTYMATMEPLKQGPVHVEVRRNSVLVEDQQTPPTIKLAYPHDNEQFTGSFLLNVTNWGMAQRSGIYANGTQTRNRGYVSGWVYDKYGSQFRYYDQVEILPNGVLEIKDIFSFPDGDYKAYFQLRRTDGTPVIQANQTIMSDFTSVVFYVGDRNVPPDGGPPPDDGPPPPPPSGGPPQ